tara:strand:+ start:10591 stop:11103 length:513 start_codon:yes stop_codon:yes gene_type:complete
MEEINTVAQLKFASQHLFNLICFIGILYYFLKKPVSSFFVNRSKNIEESINTAKNIIEGAQQKYDENSMKINQLDNEVTLMNKSAENTVESKIEDINNNVNSMVSLIEKDTDEIIKLEKDKIDSQIQAAIIQKAIKISENDLRQQLTEEKDEELIMSYLVEVKKDVISNS